MEMDYKLFDLVFQSSDAMIRKLYKKHLQGYSGWDNPRPFYEEVLIQKMHENIQRNDWVDVMIIAAMLNFRGLSSKPNKDQYSPIGGSMDCKFNIDEVRFDTRDEDITHVYALLRPIGGDCPHTIQGWHYKAFPARISCIEIYQNHFSDIVLWSMKAPEHH